MVFCHPFHGRTLTGRWTPHVQAFVKVVRIIPLKTEKMVLLWLYWDYAVGFFISVLAIKEPTPLASSIETYCTWAAFLRMSSLIDSDSGTERSCMILNSPGVFFGNTPSGDTWNVDKGIFLCGPSMWLAFNSDVGCHSRYRGEKLQSYDWGPICLIQIAESQCQNHFWNHLSNKIVPRCHSLAATFQVYDGL